MGTRTSKRIREDGVRDSAPQISCALGLTILGIVIGVTSGHRHFFHHQRAEQPGDRLCQHAGFECVSGYSISR